MKKVALLIVLAAAVAVAPGSTAATFQVAITHAGFVPSTVTIAVGDTVTWTNADTRNRQVVSTQANFTSPVLHPGDTFSFAFTKAGKFRYTDALVKKQNGEVNVKAAGTVTIAAGPRTVTYGRSTTLSGAVSSKKGGETVSIFAKRCLDKAFAKLGDTKTAADGTWTFTTKPLDHTTYRAQWGAATNEVLVHARPRISLGKIAPHKYRVRVYAAQSFAGKSVDFQRWNKTKQVWVTVRTVTLAATDLGVDPTVVSGRDFRSRISAGKRVRIRMTGTTAGACYFGNRSNTILS